MWLCILLGMIVRHDSQALAFYLSWVIWMRACEVGGGVNLPPSMQGVGILTRGVGTNQRVFKKSDPETPKIAPVTRVCSLFHAYIGLKCPKTQFKFRVKISSPSLCWNPPNLALNFSSPRILGGGGVALSEVFFKNAFGVRPPPRGSKSPSRGGIPKLNPKSPPFAAGGAGGGVEHFFCILALFFV